MHIRKVDLRLVWAVVLLACFFGGIESGAPTTTTSSTTTTGTTTTTTAGPTTTAAPTTTVTVAQSVIVQTSAIIITLGGISKANFNTAINDFKTVFANACNGYCNTDQTTARICCRDQKNYSPTTQLFTSMNEVMVYAVTEITSTSCTVTFYLMDDPSNALCAIGTTSRRKRATAGYISSAVLLGIFNNVKTSFETAYSAAVTTTLGSATTVSVTSVVLAHSSSMKTSASGWFIMLMVLVSALAIIDIDWNTSSEDKQVEKEEHINADKKKLQINKLIGASDRTGQTEHISAY